MLDGGPGNDFLDAALGAAYPDTFIGGPGTDTVDYSGHWVPTSPFPYPIVITLDGLPNDGLPKLNETDNVNPDIENVIGGPGDDLIIGSATANTLDGGPGDDLLDGGLGADVLIGGSGLDDTADYSGRLNPVVVSLDGIANDGESDEGDDVRSDVEGIWGGSGNDTLVGNGSDNVLSGGPGADLLRGLGGFDYADYSDYRVPVTVVLDGVGPDGAAGENDTLAADIEAAWGGDANDILTGNDGLNELDGGWGDDTLTGLGGIDFLLGWFGNDTLNARDGVLDVLDCGPDVDTALIDDLDLHVACENALLPEPPSVEALPPVAEQPPPPKRLVALGAVKLKNRTTLTVRTTCVEAAQGVCRGTLKLTSRVKRTLLGETAKKKPRFKTVTVAKRKIAVKAGKSKTYKVRLNKTGRKLTKKLGTKQLRSMRVTVKATVKDDTAHQTTTKKTVKLRAPKRKKASRELARLAPFARPVLLQPILLREPRFGFS